MKANVRDVLQKLLGKSDLVEQFEQEIDAVQERAASEDMVTRQNAQQGEETEQAQEQCEAQCNTVEKPDVSKATTTTEQMARQSDDVAVNAEQHVQEQEIVSEAVVVQDLRGRVQRLEETLEGIMDAFGLLSRDMTMRIGRLEVAETERKAAWLADLPAYRRQRAAETPSIYRPRAEIAATSDMPASERADAILASKNPRGWGGVK